MTYFHHIETVYAGPEVFVTGITDIALLETSQSLSLYSSSGRDGGILARDETLQVTGTQAYGVSAPLGSPMIIEPVRLAGQDALVLGGAAETGLQGVWLDGQGELGDRFVLQGTDRMAVTAMAVIELDGQAHLYAATRDQAGISGWQMDLQTGLSRVETATVANGQGGNDVFALEHVQLAGQDYLMATSLAENSVTAFRVQTDGTLRQTGYLDNATGLFTAEPTTLTQVASGDQTYVIAGAVGTGSLSVMAILPDGTLRLTDQVNDDLNTRFQSVSVLESVSINGRAFVVAGGADDGLSLMTLLPNGRLLHLESIADDLVTALRNPSGLALSAEGEQIALYVTGQADDTAGSSGVSHFRIDPFAGGAAGQVVQGEGSAERLVGSGRDDVIMGQGGADLLEGGNGADILLDGAGADSLRGGDGADIFVLDGDGETDIVLDFELGIDRIDMSGMGRFYTVSALDFLSRSDGAELTINGETLIIKTSDGSRLTAEDFDAAALTDLWHVAANTLPLGDQEVSGTASDDVITGAEGADTITGGIGDDTIMGGAGDDILMGGAPDTAFDLASGTVYRLYQATLGRSPDVNGHMGWIDILTSGGQDLRSVAAGFTQSQEFRQEYGELDDRGFVTLLYGNVLGRAPDAAGLKGWTDALSRGMERSAVVVGFSESAEFRENTAAAAFRVSKEGYQSTWFDDVYRLYQATLGRQPDVAGLEGWATALATDMAFEQAVAGFTGSREFRQTYGALDDEGFVTLLYANVLDRAPDAAGLQGWLARMDNDMSRTSVVTGFSQSREFTDKTAADLTDWVRAQKTNDILYGEDGDNLLFGGTWSDQFVFKKDSGGQHTVADLEVWDQLVFEGFGHASADALRARFTSDGADMVFEDQGLSVRLIETSFTILENDNLFIF